MRCMTELLVPHSAVRCAIEVHHSLNLIPSKVSHTATANHQTTDELGGTNKNDNFDSLCNVYIMT